MFTWYPDEFFSLTFSHSGMGSFRFSFQMKFSFLYDISFWKRTSFRIENPKSCGLGRLARAYVETTLVCAMTRYDVIEVKSFMLKMGFQNALFLNCLHIFSNIKKIKVNDFTDARLITGIPHWVLPYRFVKLVTSYMQLNFSTTATLETEESGLCWEVAV